MLENRYWNKSTITLERDEDLEKIPDVNTIQPRTVMDLFQIGKALTDLTELGNKEATKNALVIKSIEHNFPDCFTKDWLVFMINARNGITPNNHFDSLLKT